MKVLQVHNRYRFRGGEDAVFENTIALLREQGTGVRWHVVMAGNVVLSVPVLMVFAIAQRHIVRAVAGRA